MLILLIQNTVAFCETITTNGYQQEIQHQIQNAVVNPFFFYNESSYSPKYSNAVYEGKLHYRFSTRTQLKPYLGLAFGQDLQSNTDTIYNDNHLTPLVGLQYNLITVPITFFTEARENFRVINKPLFRNSSEFDFRLGTYAYQWFNLSQLGSTQILFQETYAELIFTSMLADNVIFDGWAKIGVRQAISRTFYLDGFLEALGGLDRLSVDYYNYLYPTVGLRAGAQFTNVAVQLLIKKPMDFIAIPTFANNPWNALLVFTGEI